MYPKSTVYQSLQLAPFIQSSHFIKTFIKFLPNLWQTYVTNKHFAESSTFICIRGRICSSIFLIYIRIVVLAQEEGGSFIYLDPLLPESRHNHLFSGQVLVSKRKTGIVKSNSYVLLSQKSRKVYCSDWSRWLISVVWVVRVARVVPIVFPEPVDTFSHRDFENWTPTRKVSHQCCETMEPMLETMEQTHKTLTTQNGFSRHFVVLHIQPISHWTIQLAIIIKTITIIAIHGMIQLTIN